MSTPTPGWSLGGIAVGVTSSGGSLFRGVGGSGVMAELTPCLLQLFLPRWRLPEPEQSLPKHPTKKITPGQAGVRVGGQHGGPGRSQASGLTLCAQGPRWSQGSPQGWGRCAMVWARGLQVGRGGDVGAGTSQGPFLELSSVPAAPLRPWCLGALRGALAWPRHGVFTARRESKGLPPPSLLAREHRGAHQKTPSRPV